MPTPDIEHIEIAIAFAFVFLTALTLLKFRWIRHVLFILVFLISFALVALYGVKELALFAHYLWRNLIPDSLESTLAMATAFKLALFTHAVSRT